MQVADQADSVRQNPILVTIEHTCAAAGVADEEAGVAPETTKAVAPCSPPIPLVQNWLKKAQMACEAKLGTE